MGARGLRRTRGARTGSLLPLTVMAVALGLMLLEAGAIAENDQRLDREVAQAAEEAAQHLARDHDPRVAEGAAGEHLGRHDASLEEVVLSLDRVEVRAARPAPTLLVQHLPVLAPLAVAERTHSAPIP